MESGGGKYFLPLFPGRNCTKNETVRESATRGRLSVFLRAAGICAGTPAWLC